MDSTEKLVLIIIALVITGISAMVIVSNLNEREKTKLAVAADLQECLVTNGIGTFVLWQKECTK